MKYSQYGNRSLTEIKETYKSYIKQIIDFFNDTIQVFKIKQDDLVEIKESITNTANQERFEEVWSAIGKLNLQRREFYNMVHINLFTYFEAFNKDFFLKVFLFDPKSLLKSMEAKKKGESDKILNYKEILDFSTYDEIIFHMAHKQVDKYSRLDIDKLNKELKSKFKIDLTKNFEDWGELRESYYRRNAVVHNKSRISIIYASKMNSDKDVGRGLRNNPNYLRNIRNNIDNYIDYIYDKISKKFKLV